MSRCGKPSARRRTKRGATRPASSRRTAPARPMSTRRRNSRPPVLLEGDVVHAHDLAPLGVDDLPVEHVALEGHHLALARGRGVERQRPGPLDQHRLSLVRRQRGHLRPGHRQAVLPVAQDEALHGGVGRVDHQVVDPAEPPELRVGHRKVEHLGQVDHGSDHTPRPGAGPAAASGLTVDRDDGARRGVGHERAVDRLAVDDEPRGLPGRLVPDGDPVLRPPALPDDA